ncbi:uncharacterized protein [Haliotis cracherodii]|uniref:uncharacterized protein isoform X2 n=1 Tax=Haliotis cracherodii TaxID=6455 RepID=UPI0039EA2BBC
MWGTHTYVPRKRISFVLLGSTSLLLIKVQTKPRAHVAVLKSSLHCHCISTADFFDIQEATSERRCSEKGPATQQSPPTYNEALNYPKFSFEHVTTFPSAESCNWSRSTVEPTQTPLISSLEDIHDESRPHDSDNGGTHRSSAISRGSNSGETTADLLLDVPSSSRTDSTGLEETGSKTSCGETKSKLKYFWKNGKIQKKRNGKKVSQEDEVRYCWRNGKVIAIRGIGDSYSESEAKSNPRVVTCFTISVWLGFFFFVAVVVIVLFFLLS